MPVFISYDQDDDAIYKSFCINLESKGIDYWSSDKLRSGHSLKDQLRNAITVCEVCVFLATKNSIASQWCGAELGAFWGQGITVIPLLWDNALVEADLPEQFKGNVWTRNPVKALTDIEDELRSTSEKQKKDYGINIISPEKNAKIDNSLDLEIKGSFKFLPPRNIMAVWECDFSRQQFWPKRYIGFDDSDKTWKVNFRIGGKPGSEKTIAVMQMGENAKALFDYARKVADTKSPNPDFPFKFPPIEILPSDMIMCTSVKVTL